MYGSRNISDITPSDYVVKTPYKEVSSSNYNSEQAPADNRAVEITRGSLFSDIAEVRRRLDDTGKAVSIIQIFTDAIETVAEKLMKMMELAKKALEPYSSDLQADGFKRYLRKLAKEINQIAASTEYNFNKPFAQNGMTFSIPTGDGSKIDIHTKDLRIDDKGLDITTDPQNALLKIETAISNTEEYKANLDAQITRLKDITATIESGIQDTIGIDPQDFRPELALPTADYAGSLIQKDKQNSYNTQANLTPNEVLKLLK